MSLRSPLANINRCLPFILELPFWLTLALWSLLPTTRTPVLEIESISVSSRDLVNIGLGCFYLWLPSINNAAIKYWRKPWHCHLPILTVSLLVYATFSIEWSGMKARDPIAMLYTLVLTGSAFLLGYNLIKKRCIESVHPFLWGVTICIAAIGMLYSAESFFSLGLGTANAYESATFGVQRVRGPLFVSTTGFFILIPALAFALEELIQSRTQRLFKLLVTFVLLLTIIGLGSRSALLILGTFFLLVVLSMKNKKQAIIAFILIIILTSGAGLLFFSRAKTDRLQSLEDTSRSDTYSVSFKIIYNRDDNINFFGSGYGSYWPWYIPDVEGARESNQYFNLVSNPYGNLLYHPHSTFLLLIVELGLPGLFYFVFLWGVLTWLLFSNFRGTAFPIFNSGVFASAFSVFFDFFIFRSAQVNSLWWLFLFGALALNSSGNASNQHKSDRAKTVEEQK